MIHSGGFLDSFLGPLLKNGLPLMRNIIKSLAKSVLIPLGITPAISEADAGIHKTILGSRHPLDAAPHNIIHITLNDEMEDIIKIVKPFEDSGLLLKGVNEKISK